MFVCCFIYLAGLTWHVEELVPHPAYRDSVISVDIIVCSALPLLYKCAGFFTVHFVLRFSIVLSWSSSSTPVTPCAASMKSFQALRSPSVPLTSFHHLPVPLISSSTVLRHVLCCLPLLLYPCGFQSNAFSILLLLLCLMCVQPTSIFFFFSDFLLTSVEWFSIILRL